MIESAEALLSAALSLPFEDAPLALVPDANTAAVTLLSRYGFQLQRGLRHMHPGSAVPLAGAR